MLTDADITPDRMARALEENVWSLWSNFGNGPDCAFHDMHGARLLETPVMAHPYNFVMHFEGGPDPETRIDRVFDRYNRRGAPLIWLVTPHSTPSDLGERLKRRGMELSEVMPAMYARLADVPSHIPETPDDIVFGEARAGDAPDFFHFVSYRWDVPDDQRAGAFKLYENMRLGQPDAPIRSWYARRNGRLVGKSVLHLGGGVAGLHGVMTMPEVRGCGIGKALTLLALNAARDAGFEIAVLGSSPRAETLYAKLGFERVGDLPVYAPGGGFHT